MFRRPLAQMVLLSAAILLLWLFPRIWYTHRSNAGPLFSERTAISGWTYRPLSVAESAERALAADQIICAEFRREDGVVVQVFSAKRFKEKLNEIGLFVHTPDRCWTEAGWKLQATQPSLVPVELRGLSIPFERRLFTGGTRTELVYFAGLVGGQPLPYRLDHNLSVGQRYGRANSGGTGLRVSDRLLWRRIWDSFVSRSALLGPKQFIRISMPVDPADLDAADRLLQSVLREWLGG